MLLLLLCRDFLFISGEYLFISGNIFLAVIGVFGFFLCVCVWGSWVFSSLFIWVLGSLFIGVFVFYLLVFLFICGRRCITLFDVFIYGIYGGRGM
jgi:hypothetical protein